MSLQTVLPQWNHGTLTRTPSAMRLQALCDALRGVVAVPATRALVNWDPKRPYGRRVLHESATLEAMIAGWSRGHACAPHDHGGSIGAIRILEGSAEHTVWEVVDGELQATAKTVHHKDEVLPAAAHLIHSMRSIGEQPLVTLHLYTDPIAEMVVYDLASGRTLAVDGSCGAWIPERGAPEVLVSLDGVYAPETVRNAPR